VRHAFPPPPRVPDESKVQRSHEVENISTKTVFGIEPGDTGSVIVTDGQFNVLIKAGLVKVIAEPEAEEEKEVSDAGKFSNPDDVTYFTYDASPHKEGE
jgi:hypothetical protein